MVARRAHNPEVVGSSPSPATRKNKAHLLVCFIFSSLYAEDLSQRVSEGMNPRWLIALSFRNLRVRRTMKEMSEKAKTRSIGHGSVRDDYVLRVQAKAKPLRELVQVFLTLLDVFFCYVISNFTIPHQKPYSFLFIFSG